MKKLALFICGLVAIFVLASATESSAYLISHNGHYYDYILLGSTWDTAFTDALNRGGYLATLSTDAEYNAIKGAVGLGQWDIVWIGARETTGTIASLDWINGEGAVANFKYGTASNGMYGVSMGGNGYGYVWETRASNVGMGGYLIEYNSNPSSVPEPGTMLLLGSGVLTFGLSRFRRRKEAANPA